jgi:hypothetical protein
VARLASLQVRGFEPDTGAIDVPDQRGCYSCSGDFIKLKNGNCDLYELGVVAVAYLGVKALAWPRRPGRRHLERWQRKGIAVPTWSR